MSELKANFPGWLRRRVTFYRIHFVVFFVLMMIGTLIIYLSKNGSGGPLQFIDCVYVATSALCVTGLISVRMDQLSTFDKVVLLFLMLIGSQVFTSLIPVFVRRYYFQKYLEKEEEEHEQHSTMHASVSGLHQMPSIAEAADTRAPGPELDPDQQDHDGSLSGPQRRPRLSESGLPSSGSRAAAHLVPSDLVTSPWDFLGTPDGAVVDEEPQTWAGETAAITAKRLKKIIEASRKPPQLVKSGTLPPIPRSMTESFLPREDSDSAVDSSTLAPGERRLIELRALEMLSWLVPLYFFGFQLSCFVLLLICLVANPYYMNILAENGSNVVFMAAFQAVSAFANAGLSLFDSNMIPFQAYVPYLLIVAVLILVGNTCYAPTLRLFLYLISRLGTEPQKFIARYLMEHPRRCYTQLFPRSDTLWLVFTVVLFNTAQIAFFLGLDWNSPALEGLTSGVKVLDAFFQSVSTRNAGFNVVSLGLLSPAMLVLMAGLMYVAVYPVYITRQRSREQREVYDDEDLQIFYEDLEGGVMEKGVLGQTKKMFSRDSALLFLSVFIICIIQQTEILTDPANYSIFTIIFEVISAYGNVGLSLGYTCQPQFPNCDPVPYSFSGVWKAGAKCILIMIMFLGRHRGLPDNIDAAIVIPDQKQFRLSLPHVQSEGNAPLLMRMQSVVAKTPQRSSSVVLRRSVSASPNTGGSTRQPG